MDLSPYSDHDIVRDIYDRTKILRRPLSGIISGYHELPYILIAPGETDASSSVEINGKINVSPKFILTASSLQETFGSVFDPETFNRDIEGRLFSFTYARRKQIQLKSEYFRIDNHPESPEATLDRALDRLLMEENTRTSLLYGPVYRYYPISIDRLIAEILDREFSAP